MRENLAHEEEMEGMAGPNGDLNDTLLWNPLKKIVNYLKCFAFV